MKNDPKISIGVIWSICAFKCWIHPTFFMIASLALGQSNDYSSGSEATLKDMGRFDQYRTKIKPNKMCTILVMYCNSIGNAMIFSFVQYAPLSYLWYVKGFEVFQNIYLSPDFTKLMTWHQCWHQAISETDDKLFILNQTWNWAIQETDVELFILKSTDWILNR